jgi:hypothetical protein
MHRQHAVAPPVADLADPNAAAIEADAEVLEFTTTNLKLSQLGHERAEAKEVAPAQTTEEQAAHEQGEAAFAELMSFLAASAVKGVSMIKHGRQGAPHARMIQMMGGTNRLSAAVSWGTGNLLMHTVTSVVAGTQTNVFANVVVDASKCFSLISDDRTLDLECNTTNERDQWVSNLTYLLMLIHKEH